MPPCLLSASLGLTAHPGCPPGPPRKAAWTTTLLWALLCMHKPGARVCVFRVYTHVCACVCTPVLKHAHVCLRVYVRVLLCMHTYVCVYAHACVHVCAHVCVHVCVHIYVCSCMFPSVSVYPGEMRDRALEGSRGLHRNLNPGVPDSTPWLSPHYAGLWSMPAIVSQTQAPGKACLETNG